MKGENMKEQLAPAPDGAGLALNHQTVYDGVRGKIMPDVTPLENNQPIRPERPGRQLAENQAQEQQVKEGIDEFKKEVREERSTQPQRPAETGSRQQVREQPREQRPILQASAYFSQVPESMAADAARFCAAPEIAGLPLAHIPTKPLIREFLKLRKKALETRTNSSFLSEINSQLRNRGINVDKVIEVGFIEAEVLNPIAGGAPTVSTDEINDLEIRNRVNNINELLAESPEDDWQDQVEILEQALNRLDRWADVDPAQKAQKALIERRITERLIEAKRAARQRGLEGAQPEPQDLFERMYGRVSDDKVLEFTPDDPAREGVNPDEYNTTPIQGIAQEIRSVIERPEVERTGDVDKPNADYLYRKIDELSSLRQASDTPREVNEEAGRLLTQVQALKDLIAQREGEQRIRKMQTDWSTAGEIRMRFPEKMRLVNLALKEPDTEAGKIAGREIDQWFNERFARADARPDDDWGEALGTAGQYEISDFLMALENVASGKITIEGRRVEERERDRLNEKIRELAKELKLRQYMHSVTYYANRGFRIEDLENIAKQFRPEEADVAFRKQGVVQAYHFFEQAMYQVMAKNGGYLPSSAMANNIDGTPGEVEQLVRDQMKQSMEIGAMPKMDKWEVDRAISLGRGMGIMTGRFFEIVAAGGLPRGNVLTGWWANSIVNKIAFFRQVARYDIGKEHNKFLAYKLENKSRAWSTRELEEIQSLGTEEIMDRFTNEDEQNRYIDMINPYRCGSLFTQTGWRWREEKVNLSSGVARLLKDDSYNTLLGAGLWIEKERGNLNSHDHYHEAKTVFGEQVHSRAEEAEVVIRKNLELSAKITPLKLFYNMMGLRHQVLRNHYRGQTEEPVKGQIIIKKELQDDMRTLSVLQEKLLKKRADAYRDYLDRKDRGQATDADRPDLLSEEFTTLDYAALEGGANGDIANRVRTLATNIANEFNTDSQKGKLLSNLKNKGWKIPFVFGTDDLPLNLFDFAATGDDSFRRRWGDNNSVAQATEVMHNDILMKMGRFHNQDQIIEALHKFYDTLKGHDENVARQAAARTIEGIMKFYKKDITARLPVGIGTLVGIMHGRSSYAQIAFGRESMAWDELDCQAFLRKVHGLVDHHDLEDLKKKTGAEAWNLSLAMARTSSMLITMAIIYYILQKELEDMAKG